MKKMTEARGKERQRQFGPGFLVIANFNIGRGSLRMREGQDKGNSPEYMNLLLPASLNFLFLYSLCLPVSPFLPKS